MLQSENHQLKLERDQQPHTIWQRSASSSTANAYAGAEPSALSCHLLLEKAAIGETRAEFLPFGAGFPSSYPCWAGKTAFPGSCNRAKPSSPPES